MIKCTQIATLIAVMLLAACKSAPARLSFFTSKDALPTPGEPNPMETTPEARKSTLDTIMLSASSDADEKCKSDPLIGRKALRLLTKDEYQNTIASIFKISTDYRARLPRETLIDGFRNNLDFGQVSDAHASAYLETAIKIGDEINPKIQALAGCSALDEACALNFIATFGPKLYRRPLTTEEKDKLKKTYQSGAASSVREGMTMVVTRLLISPDFLYRSEIGKDGKLTPYELASALSYFFWGTNPDDTLTSLAASGKLSEESTLIAQAERLFGDPRSRYATAEFSRAWLDNQSVKGAIKDPALFPKFNQDVKDSMAAEAEDTIDYFVRQQNSKFAALFDSNFSIGNATLAKYYGASMEGSSKISFEGSPRKGILGLGSVLSLLASPKETHPIKRGNFVLSRLFCSTPDPTPPGLNVQVPEYDPSLSTRERFAKHTEDKNCAACHLKIDGIGLGMEDFDGAGAYRDSQAGKKIDKSGTIIGIDSKTTEFSGTGGLSGYIANSNQAKRCYAVEWYRLAHGHMERPVDICAMRDIANSFEKGSMTLGQLLIRIVTHSSYRSKGD